MKIDSKEYIREFLSIESIKTFEAGKPFTVYLHLCAHGGLYNSESSRVCYDFGTVVATLDTFFKSVSKLPDTGWHWNVGWVETPRLDEECSDFHARNNDKH